MYKRQLIGCGRIAVNHIKAALNNHLEIVAVCDVLPEKMEALLAKYDLAGDASIQRYTDYRQMLAEHDLTLVSIATESGLHAQIALDCIDAGVNVIIEKPMAMSMADAEEIIRRSDAKGVKAVSYTHLDVYKRQVGDYAAAGLPVLNTQECPEYRDLVTGYEMGINCENGDVAQMAEAMARLTEDASLRTRLGAGNRRLAEERFDRAATYRLLSAEILKKAD